MTNLKKRTQVVKFFLSVGDAKPGPLLAPILGQSQINIQTFCKDFNEMTSRISDGIKLPIKIEKFEDRSFKIFYQMPSLNYIFEQITMDRKYSYLNDNTRASAFELVDILNITKSYLTVEQKDNMSDEFYLKQILSFFLSKKVSVKRGKL